MLDERGFLLFAFIMFLFLCWCERSYYRNSFFLILCFAAVEIDDKAFKATRKSHIRLSIWDIFYFLVKIPLQISNSAKLANTVLIYSSNIQDIGNISYQPPQLFFSQLQFLQMPLHLSFHLLKSWQILYLISQ